MRIAHISPFLEKVSSESQDPQGRMIFHLTKQLTRLGHEVTVFASGDSVRELDTGAVTRVAAPVLFPAAPPAGPVARPPRVRRCGVAS